MSNTLAIPVSMKSFQELGTTLSPDITLCVRGRHAVGKSEGVYQIAKKLRHDFYKSPEWEKIKSDAKKGIGTLPHELRDHTYDDGLPVIERRLSQITEGDIVGLPEFLPNARTGIPSTVFRPCDWLLLATEFPVVLFLDERNRALEAVKQSVFQLTDSKAYYGNKLHEDTRIIVAENVGDSYQVQTSDPAEISRTFTVTLEPSIKEFLDYAKTICHPALIEFLRENEALVEHTGNFEPDKKYPDRRAWVRLDRELQRANLYDNNADILYPLTCAAVGLEAGSRFTNFLRNREKEITAEEIVIDWEKSKKRLVNREGRITNEQYIAVSQKLADFCDKNQITREQAIEISKFMHDAPPEPRMVLFSSLSSNNGKNAEKSAFNLRMIHCFTQELIVLTANGKETSHLKVDETIVPSFLEAKQRKPQKRKAS